MSLNGAADLQASDLIAFDPSIAPVVRSVNASKATNVKFINIRPGTVHLYWCDYEGKRVSYGTIAGKGGAKDQPTFVTHPWVVVDETTKDDIVVFNPASWNGRAVIR